MSSTGIRPHDLAALQAARRPEEARGGPALLISGEAPEGDLILVGASSAQATAVAEALRQAGYNRRLRHLEGGIAAWEAAGLPLTRPEPRRGALRLRLGFGLLAGGWVQSRARA